MKITILAVGKIKERFYKDAIAEFEKRMGRYAALELIEVADEKAPEDAGSALQEQIRQKEGERLFRHIKDDAYVIALAIEGEALDSVSFSKKIEQLGLHGTSHIQFLIGGSLGLSEEIKKRANFKLSFSRMTFPHQLMRVILLEQIYRAYRILHGEPYHK